MHVFTFLSLQTWKGFREAVPLEDPENLVIGIEPSRFEKLISQTEGSFIFITKSRSSLKPIAAAGVTVNCGVMVIHFHFVHPFYKGGDTGLGVKLFEEMKDYGSSHNYNYVEIPFPDWIDMDEYEDILCPNVPGRPDEDGRPAVWHTMEKVHFEEMYIHS